METSKFKALILISLYIYKQILGITGYVENLTDIWQKLEENNPNDLEHCHEVYNKIKKRQQILDKLRIVVERHITSSYSEILANILSSNYVEDYDPELEEVINEISNNYEHQVANLVIARALEETLLFKNATVIAQAFWNIYKSNDLRSLETVLRFEIQLFKLLNNDVDSLQKFAYRLNKIKSSKLYESLNDELKSSVKNIVKHLPNNLKYLYFTRHFCLENVKYKQYIYVSLLTNIDPFSRYIWLWYDNQYIDHTSNLKAEVMEDETNFKVLLNSTKFKLYYYMMPSSKYVAALNATATPINHIWNIVFIDNDRVSFAQNNYLMCATESYDNKRRNVGGVKVEPYYTTKTECQWRLGSCNSI